MNSQASPVSFNDTSAMAAPLALEAPNASFKVPEKMIGAEADMVAWKKSPAYRILMSFIMEVNNKISGKKISESYPISPIFEKITTVLLQLQQWIKQIPPVNQASRFGNVSFRTWLDKVRQNQLDLMKQILPVELHSAAPEIGFYFTECWGNSTRLDYGTGHETAFVAWLACLWRLGLITEADYPAVALKAFALYFATIQQILARENYNLEPAGSHGVWCLDDYHFIPFVWGSGQLIESSTITPDIHLDDDVVLKYENEYLYLWAIGIIKRKKKGPFFEHSPTLFSLKNLPTWSKINQGMMKMYQGEVLGKFPIMQHFFFGTLLPFKE